jgi:uncharacterized membrane protein YozB (DUF420 family)
MSGIDGFLGTRATFMLDVVVLAMVALLPVLAWSVYLAKYQRQYAWHKSVQVTLGIVLLATVVLFEVDMRLNGWRDRAASSPYSSAGGSFDWVMTSLAVHLFFAVTSAVLWLLVIVRGLRHFSNPPAPGAHSAWHKRYGMLAALDMAMTAITGWIFYWLAFVA